MRQTSSLALLGAICSVSAAAAGSLPRGVGPEFAHHYQNKNEFSCISDGDIKLSLSQINDNTCDCPDGSDEPGTAACAIIDPLSPKQPLAGSPDGTTSRPAILPGFWCANEGHIGSYVPFSYVNDGVCDYELCCDGTEEYGGRTKCQNRCASIGKEYRRLEAEKKGKLERAGKKRLTMAAEAREIRRRVEAQVSSLKKEIAELEVQKDELRRRHGEVEHKERNKVVRATSGSGGKTGVLIAVAQDRVNELRRTLSGVVRQRDALKSKVDELETILSKFKEEYNPNFNDEGVKAAVKSYEDYAAREVTDAEQEPPEWEITEVLKPDNEMSGVNWKAFESDDDEQGDTDVLYSLQDYLPAFARTFISAKLDQVREWLIQNGVLAGGSRTGSESELTKAAREAAEAAERELKKKKKTLEDEEGDLTRDYGPDDIFRALKDKCVTTEAGEYTYELCWLGKTSQRSKKGHGQTTMGNFDRIDWETADDEDRLDGRSLGSGRRMVMRYENGQSCWNGPKRRTDVWVGCAETDELWRVSESEKCVYKMEVGTPAACEPAQKKDEGKDEL